MQTRSNPLQIEDQRVVEKNKIQRGSVTTCEMVVKNLGDVEDVTVDVWIETVDQKSEPLINWYRFDPEPPLRVQRNGCKLTLNFEIPSQATPAIYNYAIVFEAAQYPRKEVRRSHRLEVSPSDQDLELDVDPGFTLVPATTSAKPYLLQAGEQLALKVRVENRSKRTDRFYLTCPELKKDWFTIVYPESGIERLGLTQEADGLPLNPKATDEITLLIHPPANTLAGTYFPTLQLTSKNKENLILLDVIYFKVLPDETLKVQLTPLRQTLPEQSGEFEIELVNTGNIRRKLTIQAQDAERMFSYWPRPATVALNPGEAEAIVLKARPKKWWRRPLRGKGLELEFDLELENLQTTPEPSYSPALPTKSTQGAIVWQARPWWALWIPLLLALGLVGFLALLIWFYVSRPPLSPEVLEAKSTQRIYAAQNDPIRLNWKITHPNKIEKVVVTQLERGAETASKLFYFKGAVPEPLRKTGQDTGFCEIVEDKTNSNPTPSSWFGLPNFFGSPRKSESVKLLQCNGMRVQDEADLGSGASRTQKPGEYHFKIQVFSQPGQSSPIAAITTETVTVKPPDPPKLISFAPTQPQYNERPLGTAPSPADSLAAEDSLPDAPEGIIRLNWEIANPGQVAELRLTSLATDGSAKGEVKRYAIGDRLPPELAKFCQLGPRLTCRNLPTAAQQPGNYVFRLSVIPKAEPPTPDLTRDTAPIAIKPKALKIVSFRVEGQEVQQKPKQVYSVSPGRDAIEVVLSWQVEGGAGMVVEMLPAPGTVPPQHAMTYAIGASSSETITLKVSNKLGEQQTQSVVIQAREAKKPKPESDTPGSTTPGAGSPMPSPVSPGGGLAPIEQPPRSN
jgi:hypothetical protein